MHRTNALYLTAVIRSEEHTSELQSRVDISYAVFCLKKNVLSDPNLSPMLPRAGDDVKFFAPRAIPGVSNINNAVWVVFLIASPPTGITTLSHPALLPI